MKKVGIYFFFCFFLWTFSVQAAEENFWSDWKENVFKTWHSRKFELYVPINTWHNRLTYDHDKIKEYNERPWGIGFGNYYIDENKNQHSFYAMAFKDSHNDWEPIVGYAWQKNWYLDQKENWVISLGYTLGVTMRSDYDWIPIPVPLPIASIEYRRFAVQSTYIPGFGDNTGNVLFIWLKWKF